MSERVAVYTDAIGDSDRVLVFLHGMGAIADVWAPLRKLIHDKYDISSIAVDLPGHGESQRLASYSDESVARAVANQICNDLRPEQKVILVGHSYGGTISVELASGRYGLNVHQALCMGIKFHWTDDELQAFSRLASKPTKFFSTREDALQFFLRVNALPPETEISVERAVKQVGENWALIQDPFVNAIERPNVDYLLSNVSCPLFLARGSDDLMVPLDGAPNEDFKLDNISAAGHNCMIDAPDSTLKWLESKIVWFAE